MPMTETQALLERALRHMTPNYTPPPFVAVKGAGTRLWDTDGKEYLDFATGIGVNALGHAHPAVAAAIAAQAATLTHTSNTFYNDKYIALCERLASISSCARVFLCNSGTEAVEAALKTARRFFFENGAARTGFVATHNSFHGRTYGGLTVTGQPNLQQGFGPLLPDVSHVPYGDLEAMRAAVGPKTAAVIVEPIQGNGGILVAPKGYLAGLREITKKAGALLIFDEVQTGIGRTGKWFAHQHDEVVPDIMTSAKAVGGGLPLGAMLTTDAIAAVALKPYSHASTFGGNPVACAAGLATLDVIVKEGLLANCARMGGVAQELFQAVASKRPMLKEFRGRGLMVGLALDRPAKPLQKACLARGLLTTTAGNTVLRLLPPLNVQGAEMERAATIIAEAMADPSVA
ncbi:MAG: acetylornithine transaminase [Deltaproteobacteria bacterium]|nr:acetylornithine transaminase [Deltaproteobacteria bacterium]